MLDWLFLAALPVYTVLSGLQQGVITGLLREMVAPRWQPWVNGALHYGGVAIYGLVTALVAAVVGDWAVIGLALLWRVALFDVAHQASRNFFFRRYGLRREPLFMVGSSSTTDRALRRLASALRLNPSVLSAVVRLTALALAIVVLLK